MSKYKNLIKKVLITALVCIGVGVSLGAYLYFKPSKSYINKTPDMTVSAREIIHEFSTAEKRANIKYLNKLVEVHGTVNDISEDENGIPTINLAFDNEMSMVSCSMDTNARKDFASLSKGDFVKIKGLCSGMLMDIVLVKSVLIN